MSLNTLIDSHGRECAVDVHRVEMIKKCVVGVPADRTYEWEVFMCGGGSNSFPCKGPAQGPEAETMVQFTNRLIYGS